MFGARIGRAELEPLHVLRQAEDAVRVGADQIGLQHQLGDLGGIGVRHAAFEHRVVDQAAHGGSRDQALRVARPSFQASGQQLLRHAVAGSRPCRHPQIDSAATCPTHSSVPMS